jgi:hypothetical protein
MHHSTFYKCLYMSVLVVLVGDILRFINIINIFLFLVDLLFYEEVLDDVVECFCGFGVGS